MSPRSLLTAAVAATALATVTPAHAAGARDLGGTCTYVGVSQPSGSFEYVVTGHAEATGTAVAVATVLRCTITVNGVTTAFVGGAPGAVVVVAGAVAGPVAVPTICAYASAVWLDGVYTTAPAACH
jgi:hypothetical protein